MADLVRLADQTSSTNAAWTPVFILPDGVTADYNLQLGSSYKIGGLCIAYFSVSATLSNLEDADPADGQINVGGLPYPFAAGVITTATGAVGALSGVILGADTDLKIISGGETLSEVQFYLFPSAQTLAVTHLDTGGEVALAMNGFVVYPTGE